MAAFSNAGAEAGSGAGSTNEICVNRFLYNQHQVKIIHGMMLRTV